MHHFIPFFLLCSLTASCGGDGGSDPADHTSNTPCSSDKECTGEWVCEEGVCIEDEHPQDECIDTGDCSTGAICREGHCEDGMAYGGSCDVDEHCMPGEWCNKNQCVAMLAGSPTGCKSNAECPNGHTCDWKNECCDAKYKCTLVGEVECTKDSDCADGWLCFRSVCYRDNVTYTNDIQFVYKAMCWMCHGPDLQEGDWRWDSYESLAQESLTCPGDTTAVCTIQRIKAGILPTLGDGDEKVSDPQVGLLAAWIAGGLKQ